MAGLWERVKPDGAERINVHLITAGLKAYFVNTQDGTKGATRVQVRDALNSVLAEDGYSALTAAEETDLNGIADGLDAQPNINAKQTFLFGVEYVMTAGELGLISETKWRGDLDI